MPWRARDRPADQQRRERERQPGEAGAPAADAIGEDAEHRPEERAAEQRHGDQQALLRGAHAELLAQKRRQRSENHPHHEADVEIEQRRDERRRVAGFKKGLLSHHASIEMTPASTRVAYVLMQACSLAGRATAPVSRFTFHACSGQTTASPATMPSQSGPL